MHCNHTNAVKLTIGVFGHGWLGWRWITTRKQQEKMEYPVCLERGTKKTSESPTGIEPMTFRTPVGRWANVWPNVGQCWLNVWPNVGPTFLCSAVVPCQYRYRVI